MIASAAVGEAIDEVETDRCPLAHHRQVLEPDTGLLAGQRRRPARESGCMRSVDLSCQRFGIERVAQDDETEGCKVGDCAAIHGCR